MRGLGWSRLSHPGRLEQWLRLVTERGASDLLLVAGVQPSIRVDGKITTLPEGPLDGPEIEDAVLPALPEAIARRYREGAPADASLRVTGLGRFRINLHRERGRAAAAIRALPSRPPALSELGLPPGVERLTRLPYGLELIGGPTGSGKSTTLAALVDVINRRDPETMQIALAAGETGHLVLSTIHTNDVASTVARIADSFPLERQATIRQELSMALAAVATQSLLPRVGGGRVPAAELLMVGYGARQHIRKNQVQHLHQEITITLRNGSFTYEESLARLVHQGLLERREAMARTAHTEELEGLLRKAAAGGATR